MKNPLPQSLRIPCSAVKLYQHYEVLVTSGETAVCLICVEKNGNLNIYVVRDGTDSVWTNMQVYLFSPTSPLAMYFSV